MNTIRQQINVNTWLLALLMLLLCGYLPQAMAVAEGPEPNNPCASAQDFGQLGLPFSVEGNLDGAVNPDVDFFKFTGNPGDTVTITLEGEATQKGTLQFPYLGLFDSSCNNIRAVDSFATGTATINMAIPADGIFIIAASACCDFVFGGNGTYQLTLQPFQGASISGRLIDAVTQAAVPVGIETELGKCSTDDFCPVVSSLISDNFGQFAFLEGFDGLLTAGNYRIDAYPFEYFPAQTGIFPVAEGEKRNVGDIALQPRPPIGSIGGRLVDATTGKPLAGGDSDPFAGVQLSLCNKFSTSCTFVNAVPTDKDGKFVITSNQFGGPLLAGSYLMFISADQYFGYFKEFDVLLEGENRDLGDLPVQSQAIRFSNIRPCTNIPKQGGSCLYGVTINNGDAVALNAEIWSIVKILRFGFFEDAQFQTRPPQRISLPSSKSRTISFDFPLPTASVPDGTEICVDAIVGKLPTAVWNRVAKRTLFCQVKGQNGFSLMSRKEMHRLSKR